MESVTAKAQPLAYTPPILVATGTFAAMVSIYFFSSFQRVAVPGTIFDELQNEFGLSASSVAAMGSMFTWIYGLMQLVAGLFADRFGGRKTLIWGGLIMLTGSLIFPFAQSAWLLFAGRALTGFGASFIYLAIACELSRIFPIRQFSIWIGITLAVGFLGGMAATLPFERAAAVFGWRTSLVGTASLLLLALLSVILTTRQIGPSKFALGNGGLARIREVATNRRSHPIMVVSLLAYPIFFVVQAVLGKKFLQDFAGLSSSTAAGFIFIMTAVSTVCAVTGGFLPRFFQHRRKPGVFLGAVLLLLAVTFLLGGILMSASGWWFLAGFIMIAMAGLGTPSLIASNKELNAANNTGTTLSLNNALVYIGCGTFGYFGGLILDAHKHGALVHPEGLVYPTLAYIHLFLFLLVIAVLNFTFACLVPETNGHQLESDL